MGALDVLQIALGVALFAAGVVLAVRGRRRLSRADGAAEGAWLCLGPGIALLGLGYHLAGWVLPASWVPLKAPAQHWWIVLLAAAAVGIAGWRLEADRTAAREGP